jgi:hypothetical protein
MTGRTPLRINHTQLHSLVLPAAQGKSWPEMSFGASPGPQVLSEMWSSRRKPYIKWKATRAVYSDSWKLIERIGAPWELFDLAKDPEEKADLFKSNTEFATRLAAELVKTCPLSRTPRTTRKHPMRSLLAPKMPSNCEHWGTLATSIRNSERQLLWNFIIDAVQESPELFARGHTLTSRRARSPRCSRNQTRVFARPSRSEVRHS